MKGCDGVRAWGTRRPGSGGGAVRAASGGAPGRAGLLPRVVLCAVALAPVAALAQPKDDVAPSYTRDGFDYFSAPVEAVTARPAPHACAQEYGQHTDVEEAEGGYRCSVPTASEPRLSARLREELALIGDVAEPKRQKVVDALTEKHRRLAQCPAGTTAAWDGAMFFCQKTYGPKALCAQGVPGPLESGELGCVVASCPRGLSSLGALTGGKHAGCFKCPRGTFDAKETDAFHGALAGLPAEYREVFCKAKAAPPPR